MIGVMLCTVIILYGEDREMMAEDVRGRLPMTWTTINTHNLDSPRMMLSYESKSRSTWGSDMNSLLR